MNYNEYYEQMKTGGRVSKATVDIMSWREPGDSIIGEVVTIEPFQGGKYDAEVKQYIIDTDHGMESTVLGKYTDRQLDGKLAVNDVVRIEYKGQVQLDDGRKVNRFAVEILPPVGGQDA